MAVPSSGEIRLSKIAAEKHFDNYNHNQSVASPMCWMFLQVVLVVVVV